MGCIARLQCQLQFLDINAILIWFQLNKGMLSELCIIHPLLRLILHKLLDKVFTSLWDSDICRHLVVSDFNLLKQFLLTSSMKGDISTHHLKKHDAKRPKIHIIWVSFLLIYLGCFVIRGSHLCLQEWILFLLEVKISCQSKIGQLCFVIFRQKNVCRFQISMYYIYSVEYNHCVSYHFEDLLCLVLW